MNTSLILIKPEPNAITDNEKRLQELCKTYDKKIKMTTPDGVVLFNQFGKELSEEPELVTFYHYDEKGQLESMIWSIFTSEYEYTEKGLLSRITTKGNPKRIEIENYTYDEKDNITSIIESIFDSTTKDMNISKTRRYKYNDKNQLIDFWYAEPFINNKYEFEYNDKGLLISSKPISFISPLPSLKAITEYKYDEQDRLIEVSDNNNNYFIYKYNDKGLLIYTENNIFINEYEYSEVDDLIIKHKETMKGEYEKDCIDIVEIKYEFI